MRHLPEHLFVALGANAALLSGSDAAPFQEARQPRCRQTDVVILGAGVAGITAAQTLSNNSITNFLILERNDRIGGRVQSVPFGKRPGKDGKPYIVELGANWIQGLGSEGGPENPIWTLAKQYGIANKYSNFSNLHTFTEWGPTDFGNRSKRLEAAFKVAGQHAGRLLTDNLQDTSLRAALALRRWRPGPTADPIGQALEWFLWDFETAFPPDESSLKFGIAGYNLTFNQFSNENNFVFDQRRFSAMVEGQAASFLTPRDPRLLLNSTVADIAYTPQGIVISIDGGGCVEARFAVCTFSVGVLQSEIVAFSPPLPRWKAEAVAQFPMGTYTKIFMQFDEPFWDPDVEFFLYADPTTRGYFPLFQSMSAPGFLEGSNILFVTIVGAQSYTIEQQTEEVTKAEILDVLRGMFPHKKIPEPTAFMYPRWSKEE